MKRYDRPRLARSTLGMALLSITCGLAAQIVQAQEARPEQTPFRIVGESFVAVQVADVAQAASWYAEAFSLQQIHQIDAEDSRYFIRILVGSGLTVELIQSRATQPAPDRHYGFFKAGVFVDDIEAAFAWFKQRSQATDQRIFIDQKLQARSFLTRDPFGNRLQLFSRCTNDCELDQDGD